MSFDWPPFAGELVLSLLMAVVTMRVVATLAVFVLAPRVDGLRLLPLDGPAARLLFNWTIAVVAIGVIGFFAAETLDELADRSGRRARGQGRRRDDLRFDPDYRRLALGGQSSAAATVRTDGCGRAGSHPSPASGLTPSLAPSCGPP